MRHTTTPVQKLINLILGKKQIELTPLQREYPVPSRKEIEAVKTWGSRTTRRNRN